MTTIHCRVQLPPRSEPVTGTLRLHILDAARQDAAATVLAGTETSPVTLSADEPLDVAVDLDLWTADVSTLQTLSVEALLDVDGSGETSVGDYRTVEHIAVPTGRTRPDAPVPVPLRRVT